MVVRHSKEGDSLTLHEVRERCAPERPFVLDNAIDLLVLARSLLRSVESRAATTATQNETDWDMLQALLPACRTQFGDGKAIQEMTRRWLTVALDLLERTTTEIEKGDCDRMAYEALFGDDTQIRVVPLSATTIEAHLSAEMLGPLLCEMQDRFWQLLAKCCNSGRHMITEADSQRCGSTLRRSLARAARSPSPEGVTWTHRILFKAYCTRYEISFTPPQGEGLTLVFTPGT